MKDILTNEETYTGRGHGGDLKGYIYGENIYMEKRYTQKRHAHGENIHMERTYTRRKHIHRKDIDMEEKHTRKRHIHKEDIHTEGYRGDINTERTYI